MSEIVIKPDQMAVAEEGNGSHHHGAGIEPGCLYV